MHRQITVYRQCNTAMAMLFPNNTHQFFSEVEKRRLQLKPKANTFNSTAQKYTR